MQLKSKTSSWDYWVDQISSLTNFEIAEQILKTDATTIVPVWFPISATSKLFNDKKLLKTSSETVCLICEAKFNSLVLLLFHYFFSHSETILALSRANVGHEVLYCLNVITNSTLKNFFRIVVPLEPLSSSLAATKQWLRIIIERVTFFCPSELLNAVSFFENVAFPYEADDYEYWLHKDPQRKEKQLMEHLKKISNLVVSKRVENFMKTWNFFVMNFKNKLLDSNFFFTNFLNSPRESFYLIWIFLDEYDQEIKNFEEEIKNHIFLLYTHNLLTVEDFFLLIDKMDKNTEG